MAKTQHPESYLQITRNGVFRYRRVIPEQLRAVAGRWEIVTSLGTKEFKLASKLYPATHAAAENWLRSVVTAKQACSGNQLPSPYPFAQVRAAIPASRKQRLSAGKLAEGSTPLTEALRIYFEEKRPEFHSYNGRERTVRINEKYRCIGYLIDCLGEDKEVGNRIPNTM